MKQKYIYVYLTEIRAKTIKYLYFFINIELSENFFVYKLKEFVQCEITLLPNKKKITFVHSS